MRRWYAVQCKPRMELWARTNLWDRGFEVYLPQYLKLRRHARRRDWVPRPLFPGYLFVRADLEAGDKRAVNAASGVGRMVSFGTCTPPLEDQVVTEIRAREGEDGLIRLDQARAFKPGEELRICDGALSDKVGLFETMNDDRRVILLLDLLGRKVRVQLPAARVTRER